MEKWLNPETSSTPITGSASRALDFSDSKGLSAYKSQPYEPVPSSTQISSVKQTPFYEQPRPAPQPQQYAEPPPSQPQQPPEPPMKRLFRIGLIFMDVFLAFLVASTGALGIKASNSVNDTGIIFVGLYLILFSGILLFYELMRMRNFPRLDMIIKRNCGFLYGPIGRGCYLIFIALLTFGINNPQSLAIGTGVVVMIWGIAVIGMSMAMPDYFDRQEKVTI